ncbi:MAG: aldose epimerase family protein [Pseudomonadota bacterium]
MSQTAEAPIQVELTNKNNCQAILCNFGCRLLSLQLSTRHGASLDVILGYETLQVYSKDQLCMGSFLGRVAGRIEHGRFTLNEQHYYLDCMPNGHYLHGGKEGLHNRVWQIHSQTSNSVTFSYHSPAGECGFPANLEIKVTYTLRDDNALEAVCQAIADDDTVFNPSYHPYFNLNGHDSGNILNHQISINASTFAELREALIPTGALLSVAETPMDFRHPMAIGERINANDAQLVLAGGYDHPWVLNEECTDASIPAVIVQGEISGVTLSVYTDRPSIVFYTGNFLPREWRGKEGASYSHQQGFCLEPQCLPNSPNEKVFPSVVLRKGELFETKTVYQFSEL